MTPELPPARTPLEDAVDRFHEQFSPRRRVTEDALRAIEEEHLRLLVPVSP